MEHYDVIIIGTGAGGGTLAHRLAPTGKRILLLERGGYLPREPENWDSREVFGKDRYVTEESWYDKDGQPFKPHAQYYVGGNTKVYGAILFRLRERDFGQVQHYGGVSPAWPLSYADLEPYYTEAERLYLVHGERGEDPTEPPAPGPYPYPAVSHEPRIQQLHDDLMAAGHHPFHLPVGIDLDESDPEAGRCVRCDRFDGFPCLTDGKADAHVLCVRPALRHPNVTLKTRAKVERLLSDGQSITGVVEESGETHTADVVVVSCGELGRAPAALRGGELLRPGRAQLHGAHQLRRDRAVAVAEPDEVPEDARDQRLLLGRAGLRAAARAHPDARQVGQEHPARRRAVVRARDGARLYGQARNRLLAHDRGPAAPGQPRHSRPQR
jgi:choline dehydrogenase-like flavoprotein